VLLRRVPSSSSPSKGLYNPKAFITHAASLDQGCPHCPRFPTAASRRSLGRVSVPVWLIVLSDQLPIIALVGRYPTNQLIGRGPLPRRPTLRWDFGRPRGRHHPVLAAVSRGCPEARGRFPRATHPSATIPRAEAQRTVRLACVRRAASVRSEPGSNSQLQPPPAPGLPGRTGTRPQRHHCTRPAPKSRQPRRHRRRDRRPQGPPQRRPVRSPLPRSRAPARLPPAPPGTARPHVRAHKPPRGLRPATFIRMPEPPRPQGRRPRIPSYLLYPVQRTTGDGSKLPPQNLIRGTSGSGSEVSGQARRSRRDRVCRASPRRVQAPFSSSPVRSRGGRTWSGHVAASSPQRRRRRHRRVPRPAAITPGRRRRIHGIGQRPAA
jgi:hypothetical protein